MSDRFLSASEAARILGVSEKTIRNRIDAGTILAEKRGRVWRIPVDEIGESSEGPKGSDRISEHSPEPPNGSESGFGRSEGSGHRSESASECDELRGDRDALITELEVIRTKLGASEQQSELLREQLEQATAQIDRLTMIVANEQALRMKALPSPFSWIKRVAQFRL
jgi:excisionase family DNA binding protein